MRFVCLSCVVRRASCVVGCVLCAMWFVHSVLRGVLCVAWCVVFCRCCQLRGVFVVLRVVFCVSYLVCCMLCVARSALLVVCFVFSFDHDVLLVVFCVFGVL